MEQRLIFALLLQQLQMLIKSLPVFVFVIQLPQQWEEREITLLQPHWATWVHIP